MIISVKMSPFQMTDAWPNLGSLFRSLIKVLTGTHAKFRLILGSDFNSNPLDAIYDELPATHAGSSIKHFT